MKPYTVWIAGAPDRTQKCSTLEKARRVAARLSRPNQYGQSTLCHIEWSEKLDRHWSLPPDTLHVHLRYVGGYSVNYSSETESDRQKEAEMQAATLAAYKQRKGEKNEHKSTTLQL